MDTYSTHAECISQNWYITETAMQVFGPNKVQGVRVVQLNHVILPLLAPWGELHQIMMLCLHTGTPHGHALVLLLYVYMYIHTTLQLHVTPHACSLSPIRTYSCLQKD